MPSIDVSRVLSSPRFSDKLTYTRRKQLVGDDGMPINSSVTNPFFGVVTSKSGLNQDRDPDGAYVSGSITIHTKARLQDGKSGLQADEISWKGKAFTITQVDDYSHFGAGFTACTAELIPITGGPNAR